MNTKFLVDTNTVIFFFRGNQQVISAIKPIPPANVFISSISVFELLVGATTSTRPNERKSQLSTFLNIVQIINFTTKEADSTSIIKGKLKAKGLNMGPLDLLIAGTALCHDLTLVTNNTKEFSMPGDLKLIDWTK